MHGTITFSILNSCADQLADLHGLSDAGAGPGLMGYTPARDSEIIACGRPLTPLPQANGRSAPEQPLLGNGGVTPAILTHGLLQLFRERGYRVRLRCYNLELAVTPRLPVAACLLDSVESFSCEAGQLDAFIRHTLLGNLEQEALAGDISLLAECGVGGTLYANLWLRFLAEPDLLLAGSTRDPQKLRRKTELLGQLQLNSERQFGAQPSLDDWLRERQYHDRIQRALVAVLRHWQVQTTLPKLYLAGGMMMAAPSLALLANGELGRSRFEVLTTRWTRPDGGAGSRLLRTLSEQLDMHLHRTPFNASRHACVRRYDAGLVVEGCGLGACLVLAERFGFDESAIVAALDQAVDEYLSQVQV